jgi:hypothetical protein
MVVPKVLVDARWTAPCPRRSRFAGIARMVLGGLLDRHRLAAWQAEWSTVGPAWTGRR